MTAKDDATSETNSIPIRVLIVDDDEAHAQAVAESLERVGADCLVAGSGRRGASLIESEEFDVVVTDLLMDDIDGLEILASGKTQSAPGILNGGEYTSTIYQAPKGNWVFNAATIWWGDGLSEPPGYVRPSVYTSPEGPDTRLQKITRNLFDRMKS